MFLVSFQFGMGKGKMRTRRRLLANAAGAAVEQLEGRMLLSSVGNDPQGYIGRLETHQLSSSEMLERNLVSINWKGHDQYVKRGEWLVKLRLDRPGTSATAKSIIADLDIAAEFQHTVGVDDLALVTLPDGLGYTDLAASLTRRGVFVWAEPNGIMWINRTANDTFFSSQYALNNTAQEYGTTDADIDATDAWDITTGSSSTVIGIIDTGVDYNHPDLAANIWTNPNEIADDDIDNDNNGVVDDIHGANFAVPLYDPPTGDPMDDFFHGTHVAGIIAAAGNNSRGVAGVAWNAKIVAIKVLDSSGEGDWDNIAVGIDYATDLRIAGINIWVTNNSYGGSGGADSIRDAIERNHDAGMLFVAAAGNNSADIDTTAPYPAGYSADFDNVIAIAATDRNDNLADFSNYGDTRVLLGAPGTRILSTFPTSSTDAMDFFQFSTDYETIGGTSMATPFVTGVAALAFTVAPTATYTDVIAALSDGVDPIGNLVGKVATGGRLNARRTLDLIRGPETVTGTSSADTITVEINGTDTEVYVNSQNPTYTYTTSDLSWLTIDGLADNDTITVSSDVLTSVSLIGGSGNDTLTGGSGADRLDGGDGADSLVGGVGDDTLVGGPGNDSLNAGAGSDLLRGDGDNDDLIGGAESDTFAFPGETLGSDVITEASSSDADTLDFAAFAEAINLNLVNVGNRSSGTAALSNSSLVLFLSNNTAIENVRGTPFSDTIDGNTCHNALFGNDLDDSLYGVAGNDTLHGGHDDDALYGGTGSDVFVFTDGNLGTDFVTEDPNLDTDTLDFTDFVEGFTLNLSVAGLPGIGTAALSNSSLLLYLSSDAGIENVKGSNASEGDLIIGNARPNALYGNAYNDTLDGGAGADALWGGPGIDTADYSSRTAALSITLDGSANDGAAGEYDNVHSDIERIIGGSVNDTLTGATVGCTLYGGSGNDYLTGGSGNDEIWGGAGNDTVYGAIGDDTIYGEEGTDYLDGGVYYGGYGGGYGDYYGNDYIEGGADSDSIYGDCGNDTLYGESPGASTGAADVIWGEDGNDAILSGLGNDRAYGGSGHDAIWAGAGNDTVYGGIGNDSIYGEEGTDHLDGKVEPGGYGGYGDSYGHEYIAGGDDSDTIYGDCGNDELYGESPGASTGAADVIWGEAGNDTIFGGPGNDLVYGGDGQDSIDGEDGNDVIHGDDGADVITGGAGTDYMYGDAGDDQFYAFDGLAETIDGGSGSDSFLSSDQTDVLW